MDRRSLREFLNEAGVDPYAYDLDGHGVEDGLTLDAGGNEWRILHTERGQSNTYRWFASEDEACRFLADELMWYEPYRFAVVATLPHNGVSVQEYLEHWLGANGLTRSEITDDDFRIAVVPGVPGTTGMAGTTGTAAAGTMIRLSIRRAFLRTRGLDH